MAAVEVEAEIKIPDDPLDPQKREERKDKLESLPHPHAKNNQKKENQKNRQPEDNAFGNFEIKIPLEKKNADDRQKRDRNQADDPIHQNGGGKLNRLPVLFGQLIDFDRVAADRGRKEEVEKQTNPVNRDQNPKRNILKKYLEQYLPPDDHD